MAERIWEKYLNLSVRDQEVLAAFRGDRRQGFGKRPALLVIDVSYGFAGDKPEPILESMKKWRTSCGEKAWDSIAVIKRLLDAARIKGIPVFYTTGRQRADRWDSGSWAWKRSDSQKAAKRETNLDGNTIVPEIGPGPKDVVVKKLKPSAFFGTALSSHLVQLGCDSLIVTGTTTSGCVRATVLDAFSMNYRVSVVEDGCFDRFDASHAMSLCDMNAKYADVLSSEEVMAFLGEYPGGQFALPSGEGMAPAAN